MRRMRGCFVVIKGQATATYVSPLTPGRRRRPFVPVVVGKRRSLLSSVDLLFGE